MADHKRLKSYNKEVAGLTSQMATLLNLIQYVNINSDVYHYLFRHVQ